LGLATTVSLCYSPLVRGLAPLLRFDGRLAQLVEQLTLNQRVVGSKPTAPTIFHQN